jgi:pimeloyl-ACP methyl ester carboxylesterase
MRRAVPVLVVLLLAAGLAARGDAAAPKPIGKGASQVWVLPSTGKLRSVVVFVHGWTAVRPDDWHSVWLDHLRARGSAVVFPRYQEGFPYDIQFETLDNFRRGLVAGFAALKRPNVPVVVAGYSWGGGLAFYYAARARRWGLPVPRAVYAVFPVGLIADEALGAAPPATTRYLVLAGDRDEVVGREGADTWWKQLVHVPKARREYRLVHSTKTFQATHESVKVMTAEAHRTFWAPLDALVSQARA